MDFKLRVEKKNIANLWLRWLDRFGMGSIVLISQKNFRIDLGCWHSKIGTLKTLQALIFHLWRTKNQQFLVHQLEAAESRPGWLV